MTMFESLRVAVYLFIFFIVITSKMFMHNILFKIPGTQEYDSINEKGQIISAIFLTIIFLFINTFVESNWI